MKGLNHASMKKKPMVSSTFSPGPHNLKTPARRATCKRKAKSEAAKNKYAMHFQKKKPAKISIIRY